MLPIFGHRLFDRPLLTEHHLDVFVRQPGLDRAVGFHTKGVGGHNPLHNPLTQPPAR